MRREIQQESSYGREFCGRLVQDKIERGVDQRWGYGVIGQELLMKGDKYEL